MTWGMGGGISTNENFINYYNASYNPGAGWCGADIWYSLRS